MGSQNTWLTVTLLVTWQVKQLVSEPVTMLLLPCANVSMEVFASLLVPTSLPAGHMPVGAMPPSVQVVPVMKY